MSCTIVISAALLVVAQAPVPPVDRATANAETASIKRPTPIRLRIDNLTLDEIAAELSAQASMAVMLPPGPAGPIPADPAHPVPAPRRFTLHAPEELPFWEAIDRVCRSAQRWPGIAVVGDPRTPVPGPAGPAVVPDPKVVLVPSSRDRGFACSDGPFRGVVARLSYGRNIRFTPTLFPQPGTPISSHDRPGDESFFSAELIVMVEPRLKIERLGDLTVHEATDELGKSLIAAGTLRQALPSRQGLIPPDAAAISVPLSLNYPSEPGKRIKRLTGSMPVDVSTRKGGTQAVGTVVNFDFADIPMP
jgi:hypothetical protein